MWSKLTIFLYTTFTVVPFALEYLLNKRKRAIQPQIQNEDYYDCVFLTMKNFDCRIHVYKRLECGGDCSTVQLQRLNKFLSSAKKSISMCMYMMTSEEISLALLTAYDRGVRVRIITDKVMFSNESSRMKQLSQTGIPIKYPKENNQFMHHKFCLIDEEDLELGRLFFGSLNLTIQGLSTNFDHLMYTNNKSILKNFSEEFEDLWSTIE